MTFPSDVDTAALPAAQSMAGGLVPGTLHA
jgi:hypothetical protein